MGLQYIQKLIDSRRYLKHPATPTRKIEAEGGCGVIGAACSEKIAGRHLLESLCQMRNRGNDKGGGIAAVGMSPDAFGVTPAILENNYLLAVAYLDEKCQAEVESTFINPIFDIDHVHRMPHIHDYRTLKDLDLKPPEAVIYFVRVKKNAIEKFMENSNLTGLPQNAIEDEIVYQNTFHLNLAFYSAAGEKRAFVLSHGKNLLVLKMVGYGNDVIQYYQLEDFIAHVWIGHHRYPTKGRVWHPGGAHPFIGLNEALVHNGDFANYSSICEYLAQRNIYPLFLTDTEVSVLLFDLLYRTCGYPLEYVIEALAPTTERDFTMLPEDKQHIYQILQKMHMHGSPDGPWFFLIAQSLFRNPTTPAYRLIGITDTSMLRPQVFALQKGTDLSIGFAASEKQAIDAALQSLSKEDNRFWSQADFYWNARGGSYTDGGAFSFTVTPKADGSAQLECTDKFGQPVHAEPLKPPYVPTNTAAPNPLQFPDLPSHDLFNWAKQNAASWTYDQARGFLAALNNNKNPERSIEVMTKLLDQRYPLGIMRRSSFLSLLNQSLSDLFQSFGKKKSPDYVYLSYGKENMHSSATTLTVVVDAQGYPAEGEHSLALAIVNMYKKGFHKFIVFNCQGQRFIGNGLGPNTHKVQIDVYGSSGDYLASGIDGAKIYVHGNAQDQLAQIMKDGTLVVHGDLGQTFMYGAKGGSVFVRGNAAGRPLINAVGKPKVVINGTCLDYLAESFMAGVAPNDGGFAIVNGITFDDDGKIIELESPYPGNNLFSLASGGCIYLRDPRHVVVKDQLNGGEFGKLIQEDWDAILHYLEENARHFDIPVSRLLEFEGETLTFHQMYRKIQPSHVRVLQEEEAWVKGRG